MNYGDLILNPLRMLADFMANHDQSIAQLAPMSPMWTAIGHDHTCQTKVLSKDTVYHESTVSSSLMWVMPEKRKKTAILVDGMAPKDMWSLGMMDAIALQIMLFWGWGCRRWCRRWWRLIDDGRSDSQFSVYVIPRFLEGGAITNPSSILPVRVWGFWGHHWSLDHFESISTAAISSPAFAELCYVRSRDWDVPVGWE